MKKVIKVFLLILFIMLIGNYVYAATTSFSKTGQDSYELDLGRRIFT